MMREFARDRNSNRKSVDSLLRLLHGRQPPTTEVSTAIIVAGFPTAHTTACRSQLTSKTTFATKETNAVFEVDRVTVVVGQFAQRCGSIERTGRGSTRRHLAEVEAGTGISDSGWRRGDGAGATREAREAERRRFGGPSW